MIKLLLVDDHKIVLEGLNVLFNNIPDVKIIDSVTSGEEAIKLAKTQEQKPDLILMDLQMPGIGGLEATRKILLRDPLTKIIVLTMYTEEPIPSVLLQAGASGYLSKDIDFSEMMEAIRAVYLGRRYIAPRIAERLALKPVLHKKGMPLDALSVRELQVMIKVGNGETVQCIAELLNLSHKTINSYRYRIFEKLGISNDVELTHLALRCGILDPRIADQKIEVKKAIAEKTV